MILVLMNDSSIYLIVFSRNLGVIFVFTCPSCFTSYPKYMMSWSFLAHKYLLNLSTSPYLHCHIIITPTCLLNSAILNLTFKSMQYWLLLVISLSFSCSGHTGLLSIFNTPNFFLLLSSSTIFSLCLEQHGIYLLLADTNIVNSAM